MNTRYSLERSMRYSVIEHRTDLFVLNVNRPITCMFHIITGLITAIEVIAIPRYSHSLRVWVQLTTTKGISGLFTIFTPSVI